MRAINVNESKGDKAGHCFGLWFWLVVLACGFGLWFWLVVLACGFGLWFWLVVLACGFGLWLLLLSIAGYRLGGRHFPAPQRVIDIAALPCMGNPPYMAR
jgi:Flp pilus assembly protein TadB